MKSPTLMLFITVDTLDTKQKTLTMKDHDG